MAAERARTSRLHWRCVACRSENQTVLRPSRADRPRADAPPSRTPPSSRSPAGPVETACANCRTRHILALGPGDLRRIGPRDEIVRRDGRKGRYVAAIGLLLVAVAALALCLAAGPLPLAWCPVVAALAGILALACLLPGSRGSEGFLSVEEGLEVRGPGGRTRALIPWGKIRAAEYRLLLGRRMALWLAVEAADGTVPAAPLLAETGVALFTRARAMPQFLLAMAGRLGGRAPFLLPILTVVREAPLPPAGGEAGTSLAAEAHDGFAVALRSELAPRLVSGTLSEEELPRQPFTGDASDANAR